MFHETITFYSTKNKPAAKMVKNKATVDHGPWLSMVAPSGSTEPTASMAVEPNDAVVVCLNTCAYDFMAEVTKTYDWAGESKF